ncbi:9a495e7c-721d-4823-8d04-75e55552fffc-CDS [Sclerotinia trifoliorum]|uniref:9a495e7c-721d-4823-8d04-75e55552fffc-CDS n=1 Tax=Sclerotinia trifoliorum TaxID=28548 RepID=A0A8H2ZR55_9HELO|nr:9a495e7c-721d-4823-8d04-75e55552fffc-CDS [Sclerotinia trifoliorum]
MSTPNLTIHQHTGPFPTVSSRQHPALRFLENYIKKINSASYSDSYLSYYHPRSVFHDATGIDYVGGAVIWKWIQGLFDGEIFSKIEMENKEFFVIGGIGGQGEEIEGENGMEREWKIFGESMAHWWVRSSGEKISVPRSMVFTLVKAEGEEMEEGEVVDANGVLVEEVGFEGLQIGEVRVYYDRSLLMGIFRKSEQEKERFGA